MPPFETTQHPKPFKQRKSLGMCLYIIQAFDDLLTYCQNQMLSLFFKNVDYQPATRKHEVAGIRTKFPTKIPVGKAQFSVCVYSYSSITVYLR